MTPGTGPAEEPDGRRWAALGLLSLATLLAMSLWFTASASAPQLQKLWGVDAARAGWLTTAVQLGFVAGTAAAAALNLADLVATRWYFAACALLAAAFNAGLAAAPGFSAALALRFLAGVCLAGVYPPAMKMVATWFRAERGLALGTLIGALCVGKAAPYFFKSLRASGASEVALGASGAAVLGALLVAWLYRDGPHPFERRPFSWRLAGAVLRDRPTRLAIGGYLGHMWELYAMWTWVPAFAAAGLAARAQASGLQVPAWLADTLGFLAIAAGGPGCLWAGWMADRIGRERVVNLAMTASGTCCLLSAACFGADPWLVAALAAAWGFFVVADSAQFSALVTEVAPAHAVGTALTLQTCLGFLLTGATIQLVPALAEAAGWRWAFPLLALGPAAGIASIVRLARLRARPPARASGAAP